MGYYRIGKYNQLLKNYKIKNKYKTIINEVLTAFDFKNNENYRYDIWKVNNSWGILEEYRNKTIWSWMNSINTNYSCFESIVNECNKLAKPIKKTSTYFNFITGEETHNLNELDKLERAIHYYKNELFLPNNNQTSSFNKMRFITQRTWYHGMISQLYLLENINCFLTGNISYICSYGRGDKEDMNKGIDYKLTIDGEIFTAQHKQDTLNEEYSDDEYDYFNTAIYDDKYRKLDYYSIGDTNNNKIYLYHSCKDHTMGGNIEIDKTTKLFRISKKLRIEQMPNTEIKNELTNSIKSLFEFCNKKHIVFTMDIDESGKNLIEYNNSEEQPVLHIVFNDIHDTDFSKKIKEVLKKINNDFKDKPTYS